MDNRAEKITAEGAGPKPGPSAEQNFVMADSAKPEFNLSFILARAKQIISDPAGTWPQIKQANESVSDIFRGYFMHIAAVSAICGFLEVMSVNFFGALVAAVITWGLSLAMLYVMAMVVEALAPKFGSSSCSRADGVRLLAYSATPGLLVAPVVGLLPLSLFSFIAGLISLYGLYILYTGIVPVTGVPEQKRLTFTLAMVGTAIIIGLVVSAVLGPLLFTTQIAATGM